MRENERNTRRYEKKVRLGINPNLRCRENLSQA